MNLPDPTPSRGPQQMSSYPPPPRPRRLERSSSDRVIGGVCAGVANYANLDPTLVRVLTAVLTVVTGGTPVVLYLVALFLMPEDRRVGPPPAPTGYPTPPPAPGSWPHPPAGTDPIWGREGAPWEQPHAPEPPAPPAAPFSPPAPAEPEAPVAPVTSVEPAEPAEPADPADRR